MCFSANTSFTTSAIIFSAGTYATFTAIRFNRHYIPLALVPILFSIQQVSEGFVWITMGTSHVNLLHSSILTYLFFAFLLWPAYLFLLFRKHKHPKNPIDGSNDIRADAWGSYLYTVADTCDRL